MKHSIVFLVDSDEWEPETKDWCSLLTPFVEKTFCVTKVLCPLEVNILLTNNREVKELNHRFRNKNAPTNVLSFSSLEKDDNPWATAPKNITLLLGDIALAYETIEQEALDQHKPFDHHLGHLVVHGLLHLLGYDHETEDEAKEMEDLEIQILHDLNINNPYWSDH
jgi:probable rRNA maturation factor